MLARGSAQDDHFDALVPLAAGGLLRIAGRTIRRRGVVRGLVYLRAVLGWSLSIAEPQWPLVICFGRSRGARASCVIVLGVWPRQNLLLAVWTSCTLWLCSMPLRLVR